MLWRLSVWPVIGNKFSLRVFLLSCLVSELEKRYLRGFESRAIFPGSGLYFRNLFFEANNFVPGVILLFSWFPRYRKGLHRDRTQDPLPVFLISFVIFVTLNKHRKVVQIGLSFFRAISNQTHKATFSTL